MLIVKYTLRHKYGVHLCSSKNLKFLLKLQWMFVILLSLYVIRNFSGTFSSVEMLKGCMVRKRLGTLDLDDHQYQKRYASN